MLELNRNPQVLEKLMHEINFVLGKRNDVSFEDLKKLEYLECTLKETLRKYPPAVQYMREINEDYFLNEFFVPKGTWIAVS